MNHLNLTTNYITISNQQHSKLTNYIMHSEIVFKNTFNTYYCSTPQNHRF